MIYLRKFSPSPSWLLVLSVFRSRRVDLHSKEEHGDESNLIDEDDNIDSDHNPPTTVFYDDQNEGQHLPDLSKETGIRFHINQCKFFQNS